MITLRSGVQWQCEQPHFKQTCLKKFIQITKFFCPANHIDLDVISGGDRHEATLAEEVRQLNSDVIVECYLDAEYYHYDPVELTDNLADLLEEDNIVTVENVVMDEVQPVRVHRRELQGAGESMPCVATLTQRLSIPSGSNITSLDI